MVGAFSGFTGYACVVFLYSIFRVFGKSTLRRFPGLQGELKGNLLGLGVFIKW
jgi:hypothetical protein